MITNYPVIITVKDPAWTDGLGRLFEPFEDNETFYVYSVLHIAARTDVLHGITGYYLLPSTTVEEARRTGVILTSAEGASCTTLNAPRVLTGAFPKPSARSTRHRRRSRASPTR